MMSPVAQNPRRLKISTQRLRIIHLRVCKSSVQGSSPAGVRKFDSPNSKVNTKNLCTSCMHTCRTHGKQVSNRYVRVQNQIYYTQVNADLLTQHDSKEENCSAEGSKSLLSITRHHHPPPPRWSPYSSCLWALLWPSWKR